MYKNIRSIAVGNSCFAKGHRIEKTLECAEICLDNNVACINLFVIDIESFGNFFHFPTYLLFLKRRSLSVLLVLPLLVNFCRLLYYLHYCRQNYITCIIVNQNYIICIIVVKIIKILLSACQHLPNGQPTV